MAVSRKTEASGGRSGRRFRRGLEPSLGGMGAGKAFGANSALKASGPNLELSRLMRSVVVVEPEVGAQFPPGFTGVGVGFQVHLLVLHRASQPLHEDVVGVAPLPVHADLDRMVLKDLDELPAGELAAPCLRRGRLWSVLNTSGVPWSRASFRASAQKPVSRVLDNRQATTYRLCQSMIATRYRNPRAMGR